MVCLLALFARPMLRDLALFSLFVSVAPCFAVADAFIELLDQDDSCVGALEDRQCGVSLLQMHSQRARRRNVHIAEPDANAFESSAAPPCKWRDGVSSGKGAHEHMVGFARDESHCLGMVLDSSACPLANAASLEDSGSCFCQFGMTEISAVAGWRSCVFSHPKAAEDSDDCDGGWQLGETSSTTEKSDIRKRLHIGTVSRRSDCVAMGRVQCPDASGVSLPSQSQGGCFCEYGAAIVARADLQTCIFATSPAVTSSTTTTTTRMEMVSGGMYGMFSRPVIPFTPPPLSACTSELRLTKVLQNNLGGHGPGQGAQVIRYGSVLAVDCARSVDMVVEAGGDSYAASEPKKNGLIGSLGRISMRSGGSTMLHFSFVDSATDEPVEMGDFTFSVFGLDQIEEGKVRASVVAEGYAAYYLHHDSELSVGGGPEGADKSAIFTSTRPNQPGDDVYSPKREVDFLFKDTSEFTLQFSLTKGLTSRSFHFGGSSALACSTGEIDECIGGWQSGDGESCHERQVGADMNFGQCVKAVKEQHPLANGASVDETTRACFAHFKLTGTGNPHGSKKTCAFPRVSQTERVSLSQVSAACPNGWQLGGGNGKLKSGLNSRTYVGAAKTVDECAAAVRKMCPSAKGATLPSVSSGGCYCEFGSGRDERADLQSCLFSDSQSESPVVDSIVGSSSNLVATAALPSPATVLPTVSGASSPTMIVAAPVAVAQPFPAPVATVTELPVASRAPVSAPVGSLVPLPTTPAASGVRPLPEPATLARVVAPPQAPALPTTDATLMTLDSLFAGKQQHALSLLETTKVEQSCTAKADVVLLLDASTDGGGGGASGASAAAQDFLRGVRGEDVRVAALRFRRPNWREVMEKKCVPKADAAEPCQAEWLSHFVADASSVMRSVAVATNSSALASTATALRMASQELDDSRDQVKKILVVISDSLAQDSPETADLASDIKAKSRIVFVPATRRGALSHHTLKLFGAGKGGDGSVSLDNSEALDEEAVKRLLEDNNSCTGRGGQVSKPASAEKHSQQRLPWQTGSTAALAAVPQDRLDEPVHDASGTVPPIMLQSADGTVGFKGQVERDVFWRELTR